MAGNTKLMGLGSNGLIQLARWGEKVMVDVGEEASVALREALYTKLPKSPPKRYDGVGVQFNEQSGKIEIEVGKDAAKKLQHMLEEAFEDNVKDDLAVGELITVRVMLGMAVDDYESYYSTQSEPGVDGDGEVTE